MIFHSSFEYNYLLLPLIGFTIGFFASVIGSGGGFFFLPVLILLYNVPSQVAVATSLAATLPVCIFGSVAHYRKNHIDIKLSGVYAVAGIVGAVAGAALSNRVTSDQLKTGFGIYCVLIALRIYLGSRRKKKVPDDSVDLLSASGNKKFRTGSLYGFIAGTITGTFGTSGAAPVLAGLLSGGMPLKKVAGTSLLIITVTTLAALGAHFLIGKIDLTLVYFLSSGAVIGALAGPRFLAGIATEKAESPARIWYALGLLTFGILMIAAR